MLILTIENTETDGFKFALGNGARNELLRCQWKVSWNA